MAYDRYDTRGGSRERWRSDERFGERDRDRERGWRGRDERGFFERAGDEIASWFSDDEADRRRREDSRMMGRDDDYVRERSSSRGSWDRDRDFDRGRERGRGRFEEDRGPLSTGSYRGHGGESGLGFSPWGGGGRSEHDEWHERSYRPAEGDYRPLTGDYGRVERERRERLLRDEPGDRDPYRRTSFAGSSEHHDPHYREWRQRQLSELDRDYEEYRREHQSKFESDFGSWRERRMQKRGLLGQVREQMEVLGNDGEHVGTIDRVAGDRLILTKNDPEAGGVHHSFPCTDIDRIEGERVILDCSSEQARKRWRDESRNRALFEREDQGEAGPHMLDRSFSGTYR